MNNHENSHLIQNGNIIIQPNGNITNSDQVVNGFIPIVTSTMGVINGHTNNLQTDLQNTLMKADQGLLKQMIVDDVKHPTTVTDKDHDSRRTRVKRGGGGSVQITFKKMISIPTTNQNFTKGCKFILPKTETSLMTPYHTQSSLLSNVSVHNKVTHTPVYSVVNNAISTNTELTSCNINNSAPSEINTGNLSINHEVAANNQHIYNVSSPSCSRMLESRLSQKSNCNMILSFPKMSKADPALISAKSSNNSKMAKPCVAQGNDIAIPPDELNLSSISLGPDSSVKPAVDFQAIANPMDNAMSDELMGSFDLGDFDTDMYFLNQHNEFPLNNFEDISAVESQTSATVANYTEKENIINYGNNAQQLPPSDFVDSFLTSSIMVEQSQIASSIPDGKNKTELLEIIDVSPEIATTSGGNKIILIGSWNAKDSRYSCQFGDCIVHAELIQNGVLKCYSPEHPPEKILLTVLCNGQKISYPFEFEFVDPSKESLNEVIIKHDDWLSITNESLANTLKERILAISEIISLGEVIACVDLIVDESYEEQLITFCKDLMEKPVNVDFDYKVENTMTLLHLAAALGYLRFIQLLLHWVENFPSKVICAEASPTCYDQFHLLPIMWSAAKGHFNTTCVLLQWNDTTIETKDWCGCSIVDLARECDHGSLVVYLERILKKSAISRDSSISIDVPSTSTSSTIPIPILETNQSKHFVDSSSPRTLGRTLAHIQSILNDQTNNNEKGDTSDDDDADEGSLFEQSYAPRHNTVCTSSMGTSSSSTSNSPSQQSLNSPFNRQTRETAEFCEFFYRAKKIEKDFAELVLTDKELNYHLDKEQAELYYAANVIQTAYKIYKERRKRRDQELSAAVLIQSYYRRYKQYAAFKKMQKGAVVIQNQYRAHREKSKRKCQAASVIQSYYRRYLERKQLQLHNRTRLQHQADRKTNRYLQQTTKRFSQEIPDAFLMETSTANTFVMTSVSNEHSDDIIMGN